MSAIAVIPARFGSTRFPGKPLARQTGKYLIQHVYEQVARAALLQQVIVATDDLRIAEAVESFGGQVRMTRPDHPSGTDRVAEVVRALDPKFNLVVNVQGDEPEIDPDHIDRLIRLLADDPDCPMATLACPFGTDADPADPNCVKVICDQADRALYFSRSLVPYPRDTAGRPEAHDQWLLHLGIYAYRRAFLLEYAGWQAGRLEQIERLEQLRALERGARILVGRVEHAPAGIDTPEDYEAFVRRAASRSAGSVTQTGPSRRTRR